MPRFHSNNYGETFGLDGLEYTGTWQKRTLRLRQMTFWHAVWWAGLRTALRPPHTRPLMAHAMRGWEPLGDRASISGHAHLEIDGPVTQGDLDQIVAASTLYAGGEA